MTSQTNLLRAFHHETHPRLPRRYLELVLESQEELLVLIVVLLHRRNTTRVPFEELVDLTIGIREPDHALLLLHWPHTILIKAFAGKALS